MGGEVLWSKGYAHNNVNEWKKLGKASLESENVFPLEEGRVHRPGRQYLDVIERWREKSLPTWEDLIQELPLACHAVEHAFCEKGILYCLRFWRIFPAGSYKDKEKWKIDPDNLVVHKAQRAVWDLSMKTWTGAWKMLPLHTVLWCEEDRKAYEENLPSYEKSVKVEWSGTNLPLFSRPLDHFHNLGVNVWSQSFWQKNTWEQFGAHGDDRIFIHFLVWLWRSRVIQCSEGAERKIKCGDFLEVWWLPLLTVTGKEIKE